MIDEQLKRQYELTGDLLILKVKKSPLFVRSTMFFFAFLFFLLPLIGMIGGLAVGLGLHIGYFIMMFFFGILGFYLLRMSLWITYGKETIRFNEDSITYLADYGWFKDGRKQKEFDEAPEFSIRQTGYEDEEKGTLFIDMGKYDLLCATKMPNAELEELIEKLQELASNK
jgi:hypothetical protein